MADPLQYQTGDKTEQHLLDEASATISYEGFAKSGALTSEASWLIKKINTSGNITSEKWANGGSSHNQIWDNRTSLIYT